MLENRTIIDIEEHRERHTGISLAVLLGMAIGGLLIGKGSGRLVGTLAGALAGKAADNLLSPRPHSRLQGRGIMLNFPPNKTS